MTDFAVAVDILEITHVAPAKRVIIKYLLKRPTANVASPGWVYITDACGYRSLCDDTWICLTPNNQHPLHSHVIKDPGIYYYVWDYEGEHGLDPTDFDGDNSYIIQIALHDTGCEWVDPCESDPNLVPGTCATAGQIVSGDVGSQGNCCDGYIIDVDQFGCLFCRPEDSCHNKVPGNCSTSGQDVQGNVGEQGNCCPGYHIEIDAFGCPICVQDVTPPDRDKQIDHDPSDPPTPPDDEPPGGGDGNPVITKTAEVDKWGDFSSFGMEQQGGGYYNSTSNGSSSPVYDTSTSFGPLDGGPKAPRSSDAPNLGDDQRALGEIQSPWEQSNPDTLGGGGVYGTDAGKIGRTPGQVTRGSFGGKSRSIIGTKNFTFNQTYSSDVREVVSPTNRIPSDKEIILTTRSFTTKSGPILNSVPNLDKSRGKSVPTNAIQIKENTVYLKSDQEHRTKNIMLRRYGITDAYTIAKIDTSVIADKYVDLRGAKLGLSSDIDLPAAPIVGQLARKSYGSSLSSSTQGLLSETSEALKIVVAKLTSYTRPFTGFLNSYSANLIVTPAAGAVGAPVYASCYTYPLGKSPTTQKLYLFIKDSSSRVICIGETPLRTTTSARRLAVAASTAKLATGDAKVIFVVTNGDGDIIYLQAQDIYLRDPGAKSGIPDKEIRKATRVGISSPTELLISRDDLDKHTVHLGGDQNSAYVILKRYNASVANGFNIGVRCRDEKDSTRKHALTLWDTDTIEVVHGGVAGTKFAESVPGRLTEDLLVNDPKYSAFVYTHVGQDQWPSSEDVILQISLADSNKKISRVCYEVGPDLRPREPQVALITDNQDGTFKIIMRVPYVNTDVEAFVAGGNNIVPLDVTTTRVSVGFNSVANFTLTATKGSYFGVALAKPSQLPLGPRTFYFGRIE